MEKDKEFKIKQLQQKTQMLQKSLKNTIKTVQVNIKMVHSIQTKIRIAEYEMKVLQAETHQCESIDITNE